MTVHRTTYRWIQGAWRPVPDDSVCKTCGNITYKGTDWYAEICEDVADWVDLEDADSFDLVISKEKVEDAWDACILQESGEILIFCDDPEDSCSIPMPDTLPENLSGHAWVWVEI